MNCRFCNEPIGEIVDSWGGKHGFTHRLEDGPDAYTFCKCHCLHCVPEGAFVRHAECCDGKDAEPVPERTYSGNLIDGILAAIEAVERQARLKAYVTPNTSGFSQADYDEFMGGQL